MPGGADDPRQLPPVLPGRHGGRDLFTRWTVVLLREMIAGSTRFNDLRRACRMSPALLSQRPTTLERAGVLIARVKAQGRARPLREYRLTRSGQDGRWIEAFGVWGQRWIESEMPLQNPDPCSLMWDMRRNLDPSPMPRRRSTIQIGIELPRRIASGG